MKKFLKESQEKKNEEMNKPLKEIQEEPYPDVNNQAHNSSCFTRGKAEPSDLR